MLSFLNKKNTGTPKPLPPILVRQMADPLHWEDRKNDLIYHISHLNLSPNDTHKTLKDGLRLIVDERRAVNADKTIPAATRALSETHLLSMASILAKEIVKLQTAHPEISSLPKPHSHSLRIGNKAKKIAAAQWHSVKIWISKCAEDAASQVKNDISDARNELVSNFHDATADTTYALKELFSGVARNKGTIAVLTVGAMGIGVTALINKDTEEDMSADTQIAASQAERHYTYTNIELAEAENDRPSANHAGTKNKKAQNASSSKPLKITPEGYIAIKVAAENGISEQYTAAVLCIESSCGKARAYNEASGAGGLFQIIPSTAKQYAVEDRFDPKESSVGFSEITHDNKKILHSKLGRKPTRPELYLAHQQGAGGASALLLNAEKDALRVLTNVYKIRYNEKAESIATKAIVRNGGSLDMTAGEFAAMWMDKYQEKEKRIKINYTLVASAAP